MEIINLFLNGNNIKEITNDQYYSILNTLDKNSNISASAMKKPLSKG